MPTPVFDGFGHWRGDDGSSLPAKLWTIREIDAARRELEQIRVFHTGCEMRADTPEVEVDEFGDIVSRGGEAMVVTGSRGEEGGGGLCRALAIIDNKKVVEYYAMVSIGKTWFVMVMLVGAILLFTKDAQSLVIEPISRMMELVRKLAENPLAEGRKADEGREKLLRARSRRRRRRR